MTLNDLLINRVEEMSNDKKPGYAEQGRRSMLDMLVDSVPVTVGFASLIGTLAFFSMAYASSYMFALLFALGYSASGNEFVAGLRYLDSVASNSVATDTASDTPAWYLSFLIVVQTISVYVAGRIAGKLAPEREYLSSLALVIFCYGFAVIFSMPGISQPVWWKFLEMAAFVIVAFVAAYHARRRNIMYP